MISETKINGWDNHMVIHNKVIYPQSIDQNAPQNYYLSLWVGARGSGKTYLMTKLLKTIEKKKVYLDGHEVPQRIILICSTAHSDSNRVFKSLKNLDWDNDVIENYNDISLLNKMEELKTDIEKSKDYKAYKEVWGKFKKIDNVDDLSMDEMLLLNKYNFTPFKEIPKPKYPNSFVIYWVVDDMIGTDIFKNGRSVFTNLCIRNRHVIPGNILIATQAIMQVPKTIRLNCNLIVLFKFANKENILNDVYPTVSSYVTEEQFKEMYEYATSEAHNALVIDGTNGPIQFKKNFNILLQMNNNIKTDID